MKSRVAVLLCLSLALGLLVFTPPGVRGISSTVVISEFRVRGPNGGNDEFIELFNLSGSAVNIGGWKIRGSNASGTIGDRATIPMGTMIQPGCFYLLTNANTTAGPYSGAVAGDQTYTTGITDDGGIAVTLPDNTVVDQVGMSTGSAFKEGTPLANLGTTNLNRGYERKPGGSMGHGQDTDNNSNDFQLITPSNPQSSASACIGELGATGAANPSTVPAGNSTLLTVTVTPALFPPSTGLTVTGDLTAIGGSASQPFFDDGTNGDVTPGDNIFSYQATVAMATTPGAKTLPISVADAQLRTASTDISLTVVAGQPPPGAVVVSQIYGGGGNTGATLKNDFIEIFNRSASPVDLSSWSVQYNSATGTGTWQRTNLSGTLASGQYYLIQQAQGAGGTTNLPAPDAIGTIAMAAGAGKVALVQNQTSLTGACPAGSHISDMVGYGATATCFETAPTPAPSNTTAVLRKMGGCQDTDNNSADFATGAPNPRNTSSTFTMCGASTDPTGVGTASPALLPPGDSVLLRVTVTPGTNPVSTGLTVKADLTPIGGSATQSFFDDGTNGDTTAGDNIFSFQTTVDSGTPLGQKMLTFTVADSEPRSTTGTIDLSVVPLLAIHEIQGNGNTSPFATMQVSTTGVVTYLRSNGFFIQMADDDVDGDPQTSEGIFVFTLSAPPAAAAIGNRVRVSGTVSEFVPSADPFSPPLTEISGLPFVTLLSTGHPLPAPVTITSADTSPAGAIQQLEHLEGMRVQVDSLTVIAPTQGSISEPNATSTSNGVFYGVITGMARPFREPGIHVVDPLPPGSPCCVPVFDGNPERLRVDSLEPGRAAIEVATGQVVTGLTGVLDFAFRTYTILPDAGAPVGVTGSLSATPVPALAVNEWTVGSFNLERFFDTTNDPGIGEPVLTAAAFNNRLNKASLAIRNVMRSPDIIGVEEVENLTTLEALAARLNADTIAAGQPDPMYAAYLEEGNDIGGIDSGFLVKTSRVTVLSVTQVGKTDTFINPVDGQPNILNDRPPLVLRAQVNSPFGPPLAVTVIVNHLRSLNDVDDPGDAGRRVRAKRRAQAEFLADLIQTHQAAGEHVISVGDYNAFQFNDGYVDVIGTVKGTPTPANNVVLASPDLVNPDLADLVDLLPAEERYSFVFDGSAQVLDHVLISSGLMPLFSRFDYARNDADFPESFRNDPNRPERISDHDMPVAYFFLLPTGWAIDIKPGSFPNAINLGSSGTVPVAILSSPDFDATTVNPLSVSLAGATVKLKGKGTPMASFEDVNGDGRPDLVVHVVTSALQLSNTDTEAVLEAMTFDGRRIRATDTVRIVP